MVISILVIDQDYVRVLIAQLRYTKVPPQMKKKGVYIYTLHMSYFKSIGKFVTIIDDHNIKVHLRNMHGPKWLPE